MITVGQKLRNERIRQGLELKPIADELKISSRYLKAIEDEDWDQLPGGFFGRSFVRQYAAALGLDPVEYEKAGPQPEIEPEPVVVQSLVHQRKDQQINVPPLMSPPGKGLFDLKMWAAVGGLVMAIAAGSYLYTWFQDGQSGKSQVASAAKTKNAAGEKQTSELLTQTTAREQTESLHSISVAATESSWLEISSEGKRLFMGLLEVGQTREFEKAQSARMVVGNAGGVVIRRSGHDIGPIGPRGQVRVLLFRPDAWEILQSNPNAVQPKPATETASTADED